MLPNSAVSVAHEVSVLLPVVVLADADVEGWTTMMPFLALPEDLACSFLKVSQQVGIPGPQVTRLSDRLLGP